MLIAMQAELDPKRRVLLWEANATKEADKALRAGGDLGEAFMILHGNRAPAWAFNHWQAGRMSNDQLRSIILGAYSGAEYPCRAMPRQLWLDAFKAIGFISDGRPRPTAPVEVWRAQAGRTVGLSWTENRAVADFFHDRNLSRGMHDCRMLHGFAAPSSVLAIIDNERPPETELLVKPTPKFWTEEP